jgi:hypothetical protein
VLFKKRFWPGIADGSLTLTFRRWKSPKVGPGRIYRTPGGRIEVEDIAEVEPHCITRSEARKAGYETVEALLADLSAGAATRLYRVAFHVVDDEDPREVLAGSGELDDDTVREVDRRLGRLDAASRHGSWTLATLHAIAERPGQRAADLATVLGREREALKVDIRKLKNLGLTLSLETGYRLSPRGEAYLRQRGASAAAET